MEKQVRHFSSYVILMAIASVLLYGILKMGPTTDVVNIAPVVHTGWFESVQAEFVRNLEIPIVGLILQILVILVVSRLCAIILKRWGQPQVIGEMIAGILLGKSVFAFVWPGGFATVFPDSSMPRLYFLSQIGLIFFMFVVGLHLKISELKNRGPAAVLISHVSIFFPFMLGALAAIGLYSSYGPKNFEFSSFALFMGIALSITAFPVLARILEEKRLTHTPLGAMALTCAAVDDVTAWCILAAVVGVVKAGTALTAVAVLGAAVIYILLMFKIVRPFVAKFLRSESSNENLSRGQFKAISLHDAVLFSNVPGVRGAMKSFLFLMTVFVSSTLFASWAEDFELLKSRPRSYEDAGAICEEIARLKFERQFNNSNFQIEVGIAYSDTQRTIGELDIVVFDRSKNTVIQVAEVKCWKDMSGGLHKAQEQRARFLKNLHSQKEIHFQSTSTDQEYEIEQFLDVSVFTTIGQKGTVQAGYDDELEYDLRELHKMTVDMLRCQDRGECVKP